MIDPHQRRNIGDGYQTKTDKDNFVICNVIFNQREIFLMARTSFDKKIMALSTMLNPIKETLF